MAIDRRKMYQDAVDVQNASNLCGVANSFAQVMRDIRELIVLEGGVDSSEQQRLHPIVALWACKIADLAGLMTVNDEDGPTSTFHRANGIVEGVLTTYRRRDPVESIIAKEPT